VITGILLMLIMPALSKARQEATRISCCSNLKQIGYSCYSYSDLYDNYVLPADMGDTGGYRSWINYLYAQTRTKELFKCPSLNPEECFDPYGEGSAAGIKKASYIMNTIECGQWNGAPISADPKTACGWGSNAMHPIKNVQVKTPSNVVYILDFVKCTPDGTPAAWRNDSRSLNCYLETDHGPLGCGSRKRDAGYHHNGGFNSLMGDQHVEYITRSKPDQWVATENRKKRQLRRLNGTSNRKDL
jgi:hypothetical protein